MFIALHFASNLGVERISIDLREVADALVAQASHWDPGWVQDRTNFVIVAQIANDSDWK
jgi:hypothetical protein